MFRPTKALPLILALAAAGAAGAQTAATAPDTGTPVQGQPADPNAPGAPYFESTQGDFQTRCVHTADKHDPCQLYQLLKDEGGNPVAEFAIRELPPGGAAVAGATVVTPLETLLPKGVMLQIDKLPAKAYGFLFCNPQGCVSNIGFTAEELAAMRKGSKIDVTVIPIASPDQPVSLTVSLKGFSAGFDHVAELNKKNGAELPAAAAGQPAPAPAKPSVPSLSQVQKK